MNLTDQTQDATTTVAKALADRLVRECFETVSPHALDRYTDSPKVRAMYAATVEAFPDAAFRRLWCVLDEDRLVLGGVVTATHRGTWRDIPATSRRIEVLSTIMLELSDGRVVDMMVVTDSLALATQLGLVDVEEALGPKACELPSSRAGSGLTPCGDGLFGGAIEPPRLTDR